MPKLVHFDNLNTVRFVTFSCYRRQKLLQSKDTIVEVARAIEAMRCRFGFSVLAYVIMPNHVHLVLYPRTEKRLGSIVGAIKQHSAYRIISLWKKQGTDGTKRLAGLKTPSGGHAFWQVRCYDHNCRTPETVREKINYCHKNPVRANLVVDPLDWEWSSYRWYSGDKRGVIQINAIEL